MFCPKCNSILIPKREQGKSILVCDCGYREKKGGEVVLKESVKDKKQVEIIDKTAETNPKTDEECPKCHYGEAYYWLVQTRAGDEAETRFFKCVKCGHRWRSYD